MTFSALLLSAGLGSRLSPLTKVLPKCLMPINGKPLLSYWLDSLQDVGCNEIIINTHYKADLVKNWIENSSYAERVRIRHEKQLLGTAGTLLANRDLLKTKEIMLIHADNLCRCSLRSFVSGHRNRPDHAVLTMMTFITDTPSECGIVAINPNGLVTDFFEKTTYPPSRIANGAIYMLAPDLLDLLGKSSVPPTCFSNEVLPSLLGRIATWHNDDYHRDIGRVDSLLAAQIEYDDKNTFSDVRDGSAWRKLIFSSDRADQFVTNLGKALKMPTITVQTSGELVTKITKGVKGILVVRDYFSKQWEQDITNFLQKETICLTEIRLCLFEVYNEFDFNSFFIKTGLTGVALWKDVTPSSERLP